MRDFLYRNLLLILLAGLFVATGIGYVVTTGDQAAQQLAQETEVAKLETDMQSQLAQVKVEQQKVIDKAAGTNAARLKEDAELIREFLSTVSTWTSGNTYVQARESVKRKYKLDQNSQFMTSYFPAPISNKDTSGNTFYVVDTEGLNSSLRSVDPKVLGVYGTEYRYIVMAKIDSASNDNKASASATSVIYLSIDAEGVISDVSGYASVKPPLNSK